MFLFCIKKSFFDVWDNLLTVLLLNLGWIILMAWPIATTRLIATGPIVLGAGLTLLGLIAVSIYTGAISRYAYDISDYRVAAFMNMFGYLKHGMAFSILLGSLVIAHILLLAVAVPFYAAIQGTLALIALVVLFWISLAWFLSLQFMLPLSARVGGGALKTIRKGFLITLDNTLFTVGVALGTLTIIILSLFTALLLPGPMGILIWLHVAFKLRLYKYDYLEEHPGANRKAIPWDSLLIEERERVGKRTLRGMIFPWKE